MVLKVLHALPKGGLTKTLRIMKLTAIIILSACLAASANGYSQKVTLSEKNARLETVFETIKKQTGYKFLYTVEQLQKATTITVQLKDIELTEALQIIFANQPFSYAIVEKNIIVKPKAIENNMTDLPSPPITVKGRVVNETGEGVRATITVKGSTNRVSSDDNGNFIIANVDDNATLVITSTSIEAPIEIKVNGKTDLGSIATVTKIGLQQEVMVGTNYYQVKQRQSTGNITKITAKEIENQPVTSPLMALQGRVAGLEITPASGAPGAAPKIRIRGTNSLRQGAAVGSAGDGNYPLYVIDGVPVTSAPLTSFAPSFTSQGFDPLSTIDPANIESIEILKDGDATAIYGSRGANGVILITTKRSSKSQQSTNIDFNAYIGLGGVSKQINLLDLNEYLSMRMEALSNSGITATQAHAYDLIFWDKTRSTNWQKVLLGNKANITDIQASISSGNKNTSFRFSGGYHKETLIFPGDFGYYRFSGQLSANHISENKRFNLSITNTVGFDNSKFFVGDVVSAALTLPPNAPQIFNDDGSLNWERHDFNATIGLSTWENPFSHFKKPQNAKTFNNISNGNISYEILNGLSVSASAGFTTTVNSGSYNYPKSSLSPNTSFGASATFVDNKRFAWIIEPKISYTKRYGRHNLNFIAGTTWQKSTNYAYAASGEEYVSDALLNSLIGAQKITIFKDDIAEYRYNSIYTRLGYNWDEKYIVSLTGRRDGSSRFGPSNRFGNFGSFGAAWIFSNEKFIEKNLSFLSFGKLRLSYGITGSDNIGDYNFYNLYNVLPASNNYGGITSILPYALYNPEYGWESTKKLEAGLKLGFWNNKVNLELSWYRNRSSNQLVDYPLSSVTGYSSILANFPALVENTGLESVADAIIVNSQTFKWNTSLNVSIPRNRLIRFDDIEISPYANIFKVGEPLSIQLRYVFKGVNTQTGLYEFEDLNNDGVINDLDRKLINATDRKYYGGFSNSFKYKNFELSFLIQFANQSGNRYIPNLPGALSNQPEYVLNRWFVNGDVTDVQKFITNNLLAQGKYGLLTQSSYLQVDASFIRLKTLSISYTIGPSWLRKTGMNQMKLFIQGQNLLTITGYEGLDPETGSRLPPLRIITAGINLKL